MIRGAVAGLGLGVLLLGGCGGDESAPTFTGSDEEQVAATVNAMTAAIARGGGGELACGLMTEEGQRDHAQDGPPGRRGGDRRLRRCGSDLPSPIGFDPGDFRITAGERDRPRRQTAPRPTAISSGAFLLARTDDGWRVDVPFCSD